MEESIEDMFWRVLGSNITFTPIQMTKLVEAIESRTDNKVRIAVEESKASQVIVVTQQNIADICDFSGMHVDILGYTVEEMEVEYTIESNCVIDLEEVIYTGLAIHCTEIPEEGYVPLNHKFKV